MTLVQLEYILALNKCRNFVQAAEMCFVTQPAMTIQVKTLENDLGVIIFDRSKKPIEPTEVGQKIIEQALFVVQEAQKIQELIKEYKAETDGELKIGIIPTLAPYLLPLFVQNFSDKYPEVSLSFFEDLTENLEGKIKSGRIDAMISTTQSNADNFRVIPMFYERIYGFVSAKHPLYQKESLAQQDLKLQDMALLSESDSFRKKAIDICDIDYEELTYKKFYYEGSSLESLKTIIQLQGGMTLLPELAVADLLQKNAKCVKVIQNQNAVREVSMVISKSFAKKSLIEKLIVEIQNAIPAEMKRIQISPKIWK